MHKQYPLTILVLVALLVQITSFLIYVGSSYSASTFSLNQYDALNIYYNTTHTLADFPLTLPTYRITLPELRATPGLAFSSLTPLSTSCFVKHQPDGRGDYKILNDDVQYSLSVSFTGNTGSSQLIERSAQANAPSYIVINPETPLSQHFIEFQFTLTPVSTTSSLPSITIINPHVTCNSVFFATPYSSSLLLYTSAGSTNITQTTLVYRTSPTFAITHAATDMIINNYLSPTAAAGTSKDGTILSYDITVSMTTTQLVTTINNYNYNTILTYNLVDKSKNPIPNADINADLQKFAEMLNMTNSVSADSYEQSLIQKQLAELNNPYKNLYRLRLRTTIVSSLYNLELSLPFLSHQMIQSVHFNPIQCIAQSPSSSTSPSSPGINNQNNPTTANKVIGMLYYDYNRQMIQTNTDGGMLFDVTKFSFAFTVQSQSLTSQCTMRINIPHSKIFMENSLWSKAFQYINTTTGEQSPTNYEYSPYRIYSVNHIPVSFFPQPTIPQGNRFGSIFASVLAKQVSTPSSNKQPALLVVNDFHETYKNMIISFKTILPSKTPMQVCVSNNLGTMFTAASSTNIKYSNTGNYNPIDINTSVATNELINKFTINPNFFTLQCGGDPSTGEIKSFPTPTFSNEDATCWDLFSLYHDIINKDSTVITSIINQMDGAPVGSSHVRYPRTFSTGMEAENDDVLLVPDNNHQFPPLAQTTFIQSPANPPVAYNTDDMLMLSHCQIVYNKFNADTCPLTESSEFTNIYPYFRFFFSHIETANLAEASSLSAQNLLLYTNIQKFSPPHSTTTTEHVGTQSEEESRNTKLVSLLLSPDTFIQCPSYYSLDASSTTQPTTPKILSIKDINKSNSLSTSYQFSSNQPAIPLGVNTIVTSIDFTDDGVKMTEYTHVEDNKILLTIGAPDPLKPGAVDDPSDEILRKKRVFKKVNIMVVLPFAKLNINENRDNKVDIDQLIKLYNITAPSGDITDIISRNINIEHVLPKYAPRDPLQDAHYYFMKNRSQNCGVFRLRYTNIGKLTRDPVFSPDFKPIIESYVHPFVYNTPDGAVHYGFMPYFVATFDQIDVTDTYQLECTYDFYTSMMLLNDGRCLIDFSPPISPTEGNFINDLTDDTMMFRTSSNYIPYIAYATHHQQWKLKINNIINLIKYKLTTDFTSATTTVGDDFYDYKREYTDNPNGVTGSALLLAFNNTNNYANYEFTKELPLYNPILYNNLDKRADQEKVSVYHKYTNNNNIVYGAITKPCWGTMTPAASAQGKTQSVDISRIRLQQYRTFKLTMSHLNIQNLRDMVRINNIFIKSLRLTEDNPISVSINNFRIIDMYTHYSQKNIDVEGNYYSLPPSLSSHQYALKLGFNPQSIVNYNTYLADIGHLSDESDDNSNSVPFLLQTSVQKALSSFKSSDQFSTADTYLPTTKPFYFKPYLTSKNSNLEPQYTTFVFYVDHYASETNAALLNLFQQQDGNIVSNEFLTPDSLPALDTIINVEQFIQQLFDAKLITKYSHNPFTILSGTVPSNTSHSIYLAFTPFMQYVPTNTAYGVNIATDAKDTTKVGSSSSLFQLFQLNMAFIYPACIPKTTQPDSNESSQVFNRIFYSQHTSLPNLSEACVSPASFVSPFFYNTLATVQVQTGADFNINMDSSYITRQLSQLMVYPQYPLGNTTRNLSKFTTRIYLDDFFTVTWNYTVLLSSSTTKQCLSPPGSTGDELVMIQFIVAETPSIDTDSKAVVLGTYPASQEYAFLKVRSKHIQQYLFTLQTPPASWTGTGALTQFIYGYLKVVLLNYPDIYATSYKPAITASSGATLTLAFHVQCTQAENDRCAEFTNSYCSVTRSATGRQAMCNCKTDYVIGSWRGNFRCYKWDTYCSNARNQKINDAFRVTAIEVTHKFDSSKITRCTGCQSSLLRTCDPNRTSWAIASRANHGFDFDEIPTVVKQYYTALFMIQELSKGIPLAASFDDPEYVATQVREKYLNQFNTMIGSIAKSPGRGFESYCGECICLPGYGGKYCENAALIGLIRLNREGSNTNNNILSTSLYDFTQDHVITPQSSPNLAEIESHLHDLLQEGTDDNDDDDDQDVYTDNDLFNVIYPIEFTPKDIRDVRLNSNHKCHISPMNRDKITEYLSFVLQIPQSHLYIMNYDCNAINVSINVSETADDDYYPRSVVYARWVAMTAQQFSTTTLSDLTSSQLSPTSYMYDYLCTITAIDNMNPSTSYTSIASYVSTVCPLLLPPTTSIQPPPKNKPDNLLIILIVVFCILVVIAFIVFSLWQYCRRTKNVERYKQDVGMISGKGSTQLDENGQPVMSRPHSVASAKRARERKQTQAGSAAVYSSQMNHHSIIEMKSL